MRLELTGRHIDITPALRALVARRVAPVLRKLNDSAVSAAVVLTQQKSRVLAEVSLHARGEHFLHGTATAVDTPRALSAAAEKVERQAEKLKTRWDARKKSVPKPAAARTRKTAAKRKR